jgi:hypothetical protein
MGVYLPYQKQTTMEKLIINAKSQFEQFGEVFITIYPNRCICSSYNIIEKTLQGAIDVISHFYGSQSDDINVSYPNSK